MTTLSIGEAIVTTQTTTYPARRATSKSMLWTGRVLSTLIVLFMLMDGVMKLFKPQVVVEATTKLGYPESTIVPIGLAATAGAILYAIPQTAVLGAILLTGYMGGTVAVHLRVGNPLFSHMLFGVYLAVLAWGGLYLRDPRVAALLPLRSKA